MTTADAPASTVMSMAIRVAGADAGTEGDDLDELPAAVQRERPDDLQRRPCVGVRQRRLRAAPGEDQLQPAVNGT